jgi:hypothetical protein
VQVLILVEVEIDMWWTEYINKCKNLVCLYLICYRVTKVHDIYDLDNKNNYYCIELNLKEHKYLKIFLMEVTVTQPHHRIKVLLPPSLEIYMMSTHKGCNLSIYPQKPISVILKFESSTVLKYL